MTATATAPATEQGIEPKKDTNLNPTVDPVWQMPPVGVGEAILLNGTTGGIVSRSGDKAISVFAFTPSGPRGYEAVKHKDDPNRGAADPSPTWDYSPLRLLVNEIAKQLGIVDSFSKRKK